MLAPLGANLAIPRICSIIRLDTDRLENFRQETRLAIIEAIIDPTSSPTDNASSEPNIALSSAQAAESAASTCDHELSPPRRRQRRRIGELVYIDAIDRRRK
jgi:hypothetical protein